MQSLLVVAATLALLAFVFFRRRHARSWKPLKTDPVVVVTELYIYPVKCARHRLRILPSLHSLAAGSALVAQIHERHSCQLH